MLKTFRQVFTHYFDVIKKTIESISEDRRKYVRQRAASNLLWRAGNAFKWYNRNPRHFQASLNEAIELRACALQLFEDDKEALEKAIATVVKSHCSTEVPDVKAHGTSKAVKSKVAAARERLKARKGDIEKSNKEEDDYKAKLEPYMKGFLDGTHYDEYDLKPTEMEQERAKSAACYALENIRERIDMDVIRCGQRFDKAIDEFEAHETLKTEQDMTYWDTELLVAENDLSTVEAIIKAEGLQLPETS